MEVTGEPIIGSLGFYVIGTTTPISIYSNKECTTENSNPINADSNGRFPQIWFKSATFAAGIKAVLFDDISGAGSVIFTDDPISYQQSADVGLSLYPRTALEISAGVTPTAYQYQEGNIRRYGAAGNGTIDDTAAFVSAQAVGAAGRRNVYVPAGDYVVSAELSFPDRYEVVGDGYVSRILLDLAASSWLFKYSAGGSIYSWGFRNLSFGVAGTVTSTKKDVGLFAITSGDSYRGAVIQNVWVDDVFRILKISGNTYGALTIDGLYGKTSGHASPAGNIAVDLVGALACNTVYARSVELLGQYGTGIKWRGRVLTLDGWNIAGSVSGTAELDTAVHILDGYNWKITNGYLEKMVSLTTGYKGQTTGNGSALSILIEQSAATDDFTGEISNVNFGSGSLYVDGNVRKVHLSRLDFAEVNGGVRVVGYPQISATKDALKSQPFGSGYIDVTDGNNSGLGFVNNPTLTSTGGSIFTVIGGASVGDESTAGLFLSGDRSIKVTTVTTFEGVTGAVTLPATNTVCTVVAKVRVLTTASAAVSLDATSNTTATGSGVYGYITTGVDAWQILTLSCSSTTTTLNFRLRNSVAGTFLIDAVNVYPGLATFDPSLCVSGVAQAYVPTNVTADRAYDADAAVVAETNDVLGTLIADLKLKGIIK